MSKTVKILNWTFSVFCILGFFVYFPSIAAFLFLLAGIASLPIKIIQNLYPPFFRKSIKTALIAVLFFWAALIAPTQDSTAQTIPTQLPSSSSSSISSMVSSSKTVVGSDSNASSTVELENTSPGNSIFQITFIDVGQADSALVECDGHYMLIDGGNVEDSNRIYSILNSKGVSYLDYVIGTHAHEDHIGGLSGALSYAKAGIVFCPVNNYDSDAFRNFKAKADDNGGIVIPHAGDSFSLGSASVEILGLNASTDNTNDTSIILKIVYGDNSFLFTGDAEYVAEQAVIGKDLSSDVLKVGHHGSETSTSYIFLREVMPTYAVLSVGQDNSYGHPDDVTLSRLRDADVNVFRTDMQGDIICTSDGQTITITPSRNPDVETNPTTNDRNGQNASDPASPPQPVEPQTPPVQSQAPSVEPDQPVAQQAPQGDLVWISGSGKKYHSNPNCSNMKNPWQVTIGEAQAQGRTPCKKCY